jgi:hypothetical protein
MAKLHGYSAFQNGGGGHFGKWLPVSNSIFSDSAYFLCYVYQILLKSDDKRPFNTISLISKMAAAVILENGRTLLVADFWTEHVFLSL